MSALIEPVKRSAREIVIAPRMPEAPKVRTSAIFRDDGDVVADCAVAGCGYHVMGPRKDVKQAVDAHHQLFHSDEIGVVLLNQPRQ